MDVIEIEILFILKFMQYEFVPIARTFYLKT